jgi:hypothetical protein
LQAYLVKHIYKVWNVLWLKMICIVLITLLVCCIAF